MLFIALLSHIKMEEVNVKPSAGTVPIYENKILFVTTYDRHNSHIILPKGKIKKFETAKKAAERETYEESGAIGKVMDTPTYVKDNVKYYLMDVKKLEADFPEKKHRDLLLMTYEEAMKSKGVTKKVKDVISRIGKPALADK